MAKQDNYADVSLIALGDFLLGRDVSDTTQDPQGTTKEFSFARIYADLLGGGTANTQVLSGAKTLVNGDFAIQFLDPNGAGRDVNLPAEGPLNHIFLIVNTAGAAFSLTVKDDTPATVVVIAQNKMGILVPNGTIWKGYAI